MSTTATAPPPHAGEATPLQARRERARTRSLGSYIALDSEQTREIVSLPRPDGSTSRRRLPARHPRRRAPGRASRTGRASRERAHRLRDVPRRRHRGRCRPLTPGTSSSTRHATPPPRDARCPNGRRCRCKTPRATATASASFRPARDDARAALDALPPPRRASRLRGRDAPRCRRRLGRLRASAGHHHQGARPLRKERSPPARLGEECERLNGEPDRAQSRLREAVQRAVVSRRAEHERDRAALRTHQARPRGNVSGETSWLARRIGQLPEGGERTALPLDAQRRPRADRPRRARPQPSRGRALTTPR